MVDERVTTSAERHLTERICRDLDIRDISYRLEVGCRAGYVDILVPTDPLALIEVKGMATPDTVVRGVGQLLGYALDFPGARLFLAIPDTHEAFLDPLLHEAKITIWPNPCILCAHEHQDMITAALARGCTPREVCMTYRIAKHVLIQHRHHLALGHPRQPLPLPASVSPGHDTDSATHQNPGSDGHQAIPPAANLSPGHARGVRVRLTLPDLEPEVPVDPDTLGVANFQDQQERAFRTAWRLMTPERQARNRQWLQEQLDEALGYESGIVGPSLS